MTTQPKAVQPIPEGYHSVTPWIISRDTATFLDFMSKAFGAQEMGRVYQESLDREMTRRSEAESRTESSR